MTTIKILVREEALAKYLLATFFIGTFFLAGVLIAAAAHL